MVVGEGIKGWARPTWPWVLTRNLKVKPSSNQHLSVWKISARRVGKGSQLVLSHGEYSFMVIANHMTTLQQVEGLYFLTIYRNFVQKVQRSQRPAPIGG
jgi:hypothetical protein